MTNRHLDDWTSELQSLLAQIQANPSQDLTKERERVIVLNKLIADQRSTADA
jgi:hypothetical protein